MINESTFQRYLPEFEGRGKTVSQYMVPTHTIGWDGVSKENARFIPGEYSKKLTLV